MADGGVIASPWRGRYGAGQGHRNGRFHSTRGWGHPTLRAKGKAEPALVADAWLDHLSMRLSVNLVRDLFSMSMLVKILLLVVVLVGVGGFAVLASVDLPAPSQPVERVIPNDRFK